MLFRQLGAAPFSSLTVEADELAQVLEAEIGERWRGLVAGAVDGQDTVLRLLRKLLKRQGRAPRVMVTELLWLQSKGA